MYLGVAYCDGATYLSSMQEHVEGLRRSGALVMMDMALMIRPAETIARFETGVYPPTTRAPKGPHPVELPRMANYARGEVAFLFGQS